MIVDSVQVIRGQDTPLTETAWQDFFAQEQLIPYRWSNNPHDYYTAHQHLYHKVVAVVQGSITFGLPKTDETISLQAGDRLILPAEIVHDATVGNQGVVCLEAHLAPVQEGT